MIYSSLAKVIFFFLVWIGLWLPFALFLSKKINYSFPQAATTQQKLILIGSLYPLSLIIISFIISQENLSWLDIGWQWQLSELRFLLIGIVLALVSLLITFGLEFATGLITWHLENLSRVLSLIIPVFVLALGISFFEELIFRGFLINQLILDYPWWLVSVVTSLVFALLHLVWERQETIPQLPGLWFMGMVLILATLIAENNIGIAWGLHTGWIFGLTCIDSAELISYETDSNNLLTGVNYQPLAGLMGIFCLLFTGAILGFAGGQF